MTTTSLIEFDSKEENDFYSLICDIKEKGYIEDIVYQPQSIVLSDSVTYDEKIQLKTKVKTKTKTLLKGHIYTPDFEILWSEKAWNVFVSDDNKKVFYGCKTTDNTIKSVIEVKGEFDHNNMTRLFKLNQKWVYQMYDTYIQLVKMPKFLNKLYVPVSLQDAMTYKKGNKKGQSKLSTSRSFDEFIKLNEQNTAVSSTISSQ